MEIKFNPSRQTESAANQPVARQTATAKTPESAPFEQAQSLERSVKNLPLVRPEEVERARALVADVQYPPNEMLDRIANLLALHMQ
jgi:hypothetical protein